MEENGNQSGTDHRLGNHKQMSSGKRDSEPPVWDMSQERVFMENLLNQRFNFFLVFFSLTIAGFVSTKNLIYAELILVLGAVITYLLAETLKRSQEKLDIILDKDLFLDKSHPAKLINDAAKKGGSRRSLIGYTIPAICKWVLIASAYLHFNYMIIVYLCRLFHHCGHC